MAGLAGEFQTDLQPPDVLAICVEALDAIGWEVDSVTERRIEAVANGAGKSAADVRIDLREADEGTEFRIAGVDRGDELAEEDLADLLDRAEAAIGERIERAEGPDGEEATSDWAPAPEPVEPVPVHEEPAVEPQTEPALAPPRTRSEGTDGSRNWWDRHRRVVAIGVLVFCLGGAIGAAATGGGDDAKPVKRAAGKSKGASQKVETEVSTVTETQSVEAATTQKTPDSSSAATTESESSAGSTPSAGPVSPAAPAPPRVAKCDPGYAPQCLDPGVSDYDCQGQGDGPYYVQGPVTVIGNDRFGLDTSDHDGVGCE